MAHVEVSKTTSWWTPRRLKLWERCRIVRNI
jgi:hypothetical protein